MRRLFLSFAILGISSSVFSQLNFDDTTSIRKHITALTHKDMSGRGYVDRGMENASKYIRNYFHSIGLKSFGPTYYQGFDMPVVTYPSQMEVVINGKVLESGVDYLVDPFSKGGKYKNKPIHHIDLKEEITTWNASNKEEKWNALQNKLMANQDVWMLHNTDVFKEFMGWKGIRALSQYLPEGDYVIPMQTPPLWFPTAEFRKPRIIYLYDDVAKNAHWWTNLSINIDAKLEPNFAVRNVIGYVPAKTPSNEYIVFTAHYDHVGKMGSKATFDGASDNASGTAVMLNMAKYYAEHPQNVNIVFIACAAEEAGLLGSKHFVKNPLFPLDKIKFLINLDIWGDASNGLSVINGKTFEKEYNILVDINNNEFEKQPFFKEIRQGEASYNSDHAPFFEKGVPSFFIFTMGGPGYYHNTKDQSHTLKLTNLNEASHLVRKFVEKITEK